MTSRCVLNKGRKTWQGRSRPSHVIHHNLGPVEGDDRALPVLVAALGEGGVTSRVGRGQRMVWPEMAGSCSEASPGRSRRRVTFKCRGCSHRSSLKFNHNILTFYNHMRALLILDLLDQKKKNFFPTFLILVKFELFIYES